MEERGNRHWSRGMPCPRFGQVGSQRALYDRDREPRPIAQGRARNEEALRMMERRRTVELTVAVRTELEGIPEQRTQLETSLVRMQRARTWFQEGVRQEEARGPPVPSLALDLTQRVRRASAWRLEMEAIEARIAAAEAELVRLDHRNNALLAEFQMLEDFLVLAG